MKMMLISLNMTLMVVKKKILPIRSLPLLDEVAPSLDLLLHDLHLAHPPTQAQGLGPGKRVQVKGNARQNVSI